MDDIFVSTSRILRILLFYPLFAQLRSNTVAARGIFLQKNYRSFCKQDFLFPSISLPRASFTSTLLNFVTTATPVRPTASKEKRETCIFERLLRELGMIVQSYFRGYSLWPVANSDFSTLWNGQLRRSSPWNRVPWTFRSNDSCRDHFSISFHAKKSSK